MGELRALDWDKEMARWWRDVEKAQWKGILRENYGQLTFEKKRKNKIFKQGDYHLVCTLNEKLQSEFE